MKERKKGRKRKTEETARERRIHTEKKREKKGKRDQRGNY